MFETVKLGRLKTPKARRAENFKLGKYITTLPTAPASVKYSPPVVAAGGYGMLCNDKLGCCVVAGAMHLGMTWTDQHGTTMKIPSDAEVIAAYSAIGGYVPGDESTDNGCDMLTALNYWRQTGITAGGTLHQIGGFAEVNHKDPAELAAALWLFGGLFVGIELPAGFQGLTSWTRVPNQHKGKWAPDSWGGHCVIFVDDVNELLQTVTWGELVPTDNTALPYVDEVYAVFSQEMLDPTSGKCPAGFSQAVLIADLAAL